MAVCRFDTKKNAFHKPSALVTITTVPTPQDRALMWTATPGKSANHASPWHCNVTLLQTSDDKYIIQIIELQLHFPLCPSVCEKRQWKCTQRVCDGVCRVIGETHYISFDGLKFSFPGPCQYVLAQVKPVSSLSRSLSSSVPHIHLFSLVLLSAEQDYCNGLEGTFRVLVENSACGIAGYRCSKSITVLYMGGLIVMEHKEVK